MTKGIRTQLEPNIYQYPDGRYEILITVAGRAAPPERFSAATKIATVRARVEALRVQLTREARAFGDRPRGARTAGGTLEDDAPGYFAQIGGRVAFKADRSHLRAWFEVVVEGVRLGELSRHALTTAHINKAIAQWQTAPSRHAIRRVRVGGYARSDQAVPAYERAAPATSGRVVARLTIRHRCRVLKDFYRTLDPQTLTTPVDGAKIPTRPKTPVVTVPANVVMATLQALARLCAKTYARFGLVAVTGMRPCQVGRARPEDVHLATACWIVRDAKGEPAHTVTLNTTALAVWEAFIAADAWSFETNGFDTSAYGKLVHAAGWPKGIRPYAARHSIARAMIEAGINLGDVQAHLGHTDPKTTRIYAPFVVDRQRVVSEQMTPYLADAFKPRLVKG